MKRLFAILLFLFTAISLPACNFETEVIGNLTVPDQTVASSGPKTMFLGIYDEASYYFDNTVYECAQGYIYTRGDTSMPLLNTNQSPALCKEELFQVIYTSQTQTPMYTDPTTP